MIVKSIYIVFVDDTGKEVVCEQAEDFLWRISGPVYPKVMKLLSWLSDWRKENDLDTKNQQRKRGTDADSPRKS